MAAKAVSIHEANRDLLKPFREALYHGDFSSLMSVVTNLFAPDAKIRLAQPIEDVDGPKGLLKDVYRPLFDAIPDLERRDTIVIAGDVNGQNWVGCGGYYTGVFEQPWLHIPPTGHMVSMRFHEFFQLEDGRVTDMQALWDIPEMMMQANAWPMSPSLGREWHVPGPATQDGIQSGPRDADQSQASVKLVSNMLAGLGNFAKGGVEVMHLDRYWHAAMSWYGPSGIGTARRIQGFRNWHQIPFLNAMPDRVGSLGQGNLFGEGNYVGFTAWPGMHMTISNDGFLGIAPSNQKITMRSLDFWRCEGGLIRENWVLVDLLHVYHQIGVDVLARMREFNKARR